MDILSEYIIRNFNVIQKVKCSLPGCSDPIHRTVNFYEYTLTRGEKEIAELQFCKNHYKNINAIIKELKEIAPSKIIATKTLQAQEC